MIQLYGSFHKNDTKSLRCLHYSVTVVENQIDIVQKLDCQTRQCFDDALLEIENVAKRIPDRRGSG